MVRRNNLVLNSNQEKPILLDLIYRKSGFKKPVLVFCHGYKGFKDWGAWNLMGEKFAEHEFCFIKFNFSHNGGTLTQPIDFPDLEAFGKNTYSKELDDLNTVINWIENEFKNDEDIDTSRIFLLGHSRGGGIVTIKAQEDSRIKKVISLAGVSDFKNRFPKGEALLSWQKNGVMYIVNGRTKQNMPHYYEYYEDFIENEERLTIKRAASNLKIPHLIIHGEQDTSVSILEAKNLHEWNPNSALKIIKEADHVFNTKHPWNENKMPVQLIEVIESIRLWSISDSNR